MSQRKWTGILTENILNLGDAEAGLDFTFKKGQKVIVRKKRVYGEKNTWTGKYEYHYYDERGKGLVRMSEFLIDTIKTK